MQKRCMLFLVLVFSIAALSTPAKAGWKIKKPRITISKPKIKIKVPEVRVGFDKNGLPTAPVPTGKTITKIVSGPFVILATDELGKQSTKLLSDLEKIQNKAITDTTITVGKGFGDIVGEIGRVPKNVTKVVKTIGQGGERYVASNIRIISETELRLREGKILDAMYHLAVDPMIDQQSNTATMLNDNSILSTVGAIAANTALPGGGGAAAYAAWLTYNKTKDPDLALRMGILAGLTTKANVAVGGMDAGQTEHLALKAAAAGAVGGIAIAAAGGDEKSIRQSAILGSLQVLIQDGYKTYTNGRTLDPSPASLDSICSTPLQADASCTNGVPVLKDSNGLPEATNPQTNELYKTVQKPNGNWDYEPSFYEAQRNKDPFLRPRLVTDIDKVPSGTNMVGVGHPFDRSLKGDFAKINTSWTLEGSKPMTIASQIPAVNAMSFGHDKFVIQYRPSDLVNKATILPAVIVTYYGTSGPQQTKLMQTGIENNNHGNLDTPPPELQRFVSAGVEPSFICNKDNLSRYIGVRKGEDPEKLNCAVVYEKYGEKTGFLNSIKALWNANEEARYCDGKPKEIADNLLKEGWSCLVGEL